MIGKKEYANTIELQLLKKEKASLESKVFKHQKEQESLKEKVKLLEDEKESLKQLIDNAEKGSVNKVSIDEIKLRSNIRDYYEFEEIEDLAIDIMINNQLQPVLITKDNYLISGHRRYFALKLINSETGKINLSANILEKAINKPSFLVTYQIDRANTEISDIELQDLQYSENNERRSIDNFQLSKLYNNYLTQGYEQKDLVSKFKKTKGNISSVVAINKIDSKLVRWLKEFQVFAWSKERYLQESLNPFSEQQEQFYHNNKGIIGWKPLYNIAKQSSLEEQKKVFLELYGTRLTKDELASEYFSNLPEKQQELYSVNNVIDSALKQTKILNETINKLQKLKPNQDITKLVDSLSYLEKTLKEFER